MSVIAVLGDDDGEWNVWIGMEQDFPPPQGFSFVIGVGATRDEAMAAAAKDLEAALAKLRQEAP